MSSMKTLHFDDESELVAFLREAPTTRMLEAADPGEWIVREATARFYPPEGAMEAGKFRPPRSSVKIPVPDGLLMIAELLAKEKGTTRNKVLSALVADELFLALREWRYFEKRSKDVERNI